MNFDHISSQAHIFFDRVDACKDYSCELCKMNSVRPCGQDTMKPAYYEGSSIKAKCDQPLSLQLIDLRTGNVHRANAEVAIVIVSERAISRGFAGAHPLCSDNLGSFVLNLSAKVKINQFIVAADVISMFHE